MGPSAILMFSTGSYNLTSVIPIISGCFSLIYLFNSCKVDINPLILVYATDHFVFPLPLFHPSIPFLSDTTSSAFTFQQNFFFTSSDLFSIFSLASFINSFIFCLSSSFMSLLIQTFLYRSTLSSFHAFCFFNGEVSTLHVLMHISSLASLL